MTTKSDAAFNLVFVLADQFRAMCLEDDPVRTPRLDEFAEEALQLPQAVSNYPVCSPHRAMMLTGVHPSTSGVIMNFNTMNCARGVHLDPESPSWAEVLAAKGYQTGWIGKWHLHEPVIPEDEIYGEGRRDDGKVWDCYSAPDQRFGFKYWYSHGCCDNHLEPHYWTGDAPREERIDVSEWSAKHETDRALEFLAEHKDQPFALGISWNPPHQPFEQLPEWAPLEHYEQMEDRQLLHRPNVDFSHPTTEQALDVAPKYFAAVECVDEQFGRLLDALDELGLADNTIVVFTSDHGMQLGSHGIIDKNVPFEESMRLPCVIRIPGVEKHETDVMFSSVDIAPTLLGLLDAEVPLEMQGRNLAEVLRGDEPRDEDEATIYYCWHPDPKGASLRGLRTHDFKYVTGVNHDGSCFDYGYDLARDPYEMNRIEDVDRLAPYAHRLAEELNRVNERWPGMTWLRERGRKE